MKLSVEARNRLSISAEHFGRATTYLERLSEHDNASPEYEALLVASVVSYVAPFTNNERSSAPKADPTIHDVVYSNFTPDQKKLHDKLVRTRHKAVCHAEYGFYPTGHVGNGVMLSKFFSIVSVFPDPASTAEFADLVKRAHGVAGFLIESSLKQAP